MATPQPISPMQAYREAQARLDAAAREAKAREQQQQNQSPIGSAVGAAGGRYIMDSVLGSGGGAAEVAQGASALPTQYPGTFAQTPLPSAAPYTPSGTIEATQNAPGFFTTPLDTLGGYTPAQALSAVAAVKGGYDSYKAWEHGGKGLRGSMGTAGAGIGYLAGGPVGGVIGAGIGNALGYGMKRFGLVHKTTKQRQAERAQKLFEDDVTGFRETFAADRQGPGPNENGQQASGYDPDFIGNDPETGAWINNKFARTRLESDLRPDDIMRSVGLFEAFGDDWMGSYSDSQRRAISQVLLDNGLIREGQGGIYVTDVDKARQLAAGVMDGSVAPQELGTPQQRGGDSAAASMEDFDSQMDSVLSDMQSLSASAARDAKKQDLVSMAARTPSIPKVGGSSTIRTGVADLDGILQGVLG